MKYILYFYFLFSLIFAQNYDIEDIRNNLKSNNFHLRSQVLQQVVYMYEDAEPLIPELLELLKKEKGQNRYLVIQALGNIGELAKSAIPFLQKVIEEDDFYSSYYAILTLGQIKDNSSMPFLLKKMKDEDPNIRAAVIAAINMISPPDTISLFTKYSEDPDALVQKAIITSLQLRQLDNEVFAILIKNLKHPDSDVQFLASQLLEITEENAKKVIPVYLELLHSKDPRIVANVLGDFANSPKLSEVAIPEIIPLLTHKDYSKYASYALTKIGKACVPFLEKDLLSNREVERQQAVIMMQRLGEIKPYASQIIQMAVKDQSSLVRAACLASLAYIKEVNSGDLEFLQQHLQNAQVQLQTVQVIGVLQLSSFVPQLLKLLPNSDKTLRQNLYVALGNISFIEKSLEDVLVKGLQEEELLLQETLLRYLGKIKSKKAVPEVKKMLNKDHPLYVLAIIKSGEIGIDAQELLPELNRIFKEDKNYINKNYCMHAMVKMGEGCIPYFLENLDYQDNLVRTYSLSGLIQMKPTEEILNKLLEMSKKDIPRNLKLKAQQTYNYLLKQKNKQ